MNSDTRIALARTAQRAEWRSCSSVVCVSRYCDVSPNEGDGSYQGIDRRDPVESAWSLSGGLMLPILQDLARDILRALPEVVGCLPREEVEGVLSGLPGMTQCAR